MLGILGSIVTSNFIRNVLFKVIVLECYLINNSIKMDNKLC